MKKTKLLMMALLLALSSVTQAHGVHDLKVRVEAPKGYTEAFLKFRYELACDQHEKPAVHTVHGSVMLADRRVRFDLFEAAGRAMTEVSLGMIGAGDGVWITIQRNEHCRVKELGTSIERLDYAAGQENSWSKLALEHSPFIGVRDDQFANPNTDVPMLMVYSLEDLENGGKALRYTAFFSDEDSKAWSDDVGGQMARSGRGSDIEWAYKVEFDANRTPRRRIYQSDWEAFGANPRVRLPHSEQEFTGNYLPGTNHPILFNAANNNVFNDTPSQTQSLEFMTGHHLVPRDRSRFPTAREALMQKYSWMAKVTDLELAVEGKLSRPGTDYIYLLSNGLLLF